MFPPVAEPENAAGVEANWSMVIFIFPTMMMDGGSQIKNSVTFTPVPPLPEVIWKWSAQKTQEK